MDNSYRQHQRTIDQLTRAIAQSRTIQMRYYSASRDVTNRREADPYRLWYTDGALYLIAHCHRHGEPRMFAVDRIRSLTITNQPCQLPLGFDLDAYVRDALVVMRGKPIEVEQLFDRSNCSVGKGSPVASESTEYRAQGWTGNHAVASRRHPRVSGVDFTFWQWRAGYRAAIATRKGAGRGTKNIFARVTPDVTLVW